MKVYLVGGAVRDKLLNFPVIEYDWVVVGETPESMITQGYKAVGKDFPVFLHPQTKDEYALARTEKKIATGYKGFNVYASPEITLEQDLIRRDLTINAIAMSKNGDIIDPYQGKQDLDNRLLRHVSSAFSEDPVRVLRVARFTARYQHLGFKVAPETMKLMQQMVKAGEVDALVPERVWAETVKALSERQPQAYFKILKECGALARIFPELNALFGVPQPAQHHPEIDTGIHSLMVLEQATLLSPLPEVRFAALVHDLGKALTSANKWPSHHGHEAGGLPALTTLTQRLRVPNIAKKLAMQVMEYHTLCHRALELRPATIVDLFQNLNAIKNNHHLKKFLLACEADAKGRTGFEQRDYPQSRYLLAMQQATTTIDKRPIFEKGLSGEAVGLAIRDLRIMAVKRAKAQFTADNNAK